MILMKFGDLSGPVKIEGYDGWSELNSYVFGIEKEIKSNAGASLGFARPDFDDLTITKNVDRITPDLFKFSTVVQANDVHIDYVVPSESGHVALLKLMVTGAIISDYLLSVDGDTPSETISLHFSKISIAYQDVDEFGAVTGSKEVGWSLVENRFS